MLKLFFAPTAKEDKRKYSGKEKSVRVSYDEKGKVLVQEKERE